MKKIKTSWDLSDLYSGPSDKKIEQDVVTIEKAYESFAKKYSAKNDYLKDGKALLSALRDLEKLQGVLSSGKPLWYLYHLQSINSQDKVVNSQIALFEPRLTAAGNHILFFTLTLGKIDRKLQQRFLSDKKLAVFHYFLKQIFDTARYDLTEPEEKIMSLKSRPAESMWVESFSKLLSNQTVTYKKKEIPYAEASNLIHQLPTKERRKLHEACMNVLKKIAYFAESEINAIYSNKKIDDDLRGLEHPYSATILGYQNEEQVVLSLVKAVTEYFPISQRFYKLKARLLNLPHLTYADRMIGIGKNEKRVSFEESLCIVREGFSKAKKEYADQLDDMLTKGRIDVFPKKGKTGGAYCSGGINVPTIVMLNQTSSLDAVMTLAHEMGHAIHTELSKKSPLIYQHYSISVAEVASTFFENLAFEEVFDRLSKKEQIVMLCERIQDFISTIFRQIACFNFELALHTDIRKKGMLTKEEMGALHNMHMSAYLGPTVKMNELDGYFFASWGHIRRFFYVYSYAYGALISRALYKKYKEDPSYIDNINSFMEAGSTMSPEDIFRSIGIDVSDPAFFKEGLKSIEDDITRLEKLAKEAKMI